MDPLSAIGVVFAGGLILYGLLRGKPSLVPAAPPTVRVADAKPGSFVRVVGRIVDGGILVAPITGRTCVSFDAVVTLASRHGADGIVARGVRGTPFVIDDGSGKALVDPRGAFIRVVYDHSVRGGVVDLGKVADPEFVAHLGSARGLQFEEGVLQIGEQVVVDGLVGGAAEADSDPVYRRMAETRLRLAGAADRPAVVSELPADLAAARP